MVDKQKILIVDDERLNINVLNDLLKKDYKIMAAINGKQGIKAALSDNRPDLILLDVMMPEMDGYEVCRILKANELTRDIPVIFVTAMRTKEDETKGFSVGAVDYITKPISPSTVEARVKTHLELNNAYKVINRQQKIMEAELEVARDIQLGMLPHNFPKSDNFELNASMVSAKEIGGDFYDFFYIDRDHLCLCIGDVSGKGVPAALFMGVTKSIIKSRSNDDYSTASILTHVNSEISQNNESCMFVTVFLLILNIQTGESIYTNAGHNPPFIRKDNGEINRISHRHGIVLGAMEGSTYKESSLTLEKDDILLLYTDGVTEAMNIDSSMFTEKRLINILESKVVSKPKDLVNRIFSDVNSFENGIEQTDDITVLAIKYNGCIEQIINSNIEIIIDNNIEDIDIILKEFESFAKENRLNIRDISRINTVFDELLNNIISYGYIDKKIHKIIINIELYGTRLLIKITDDGIPFNPFMNINPDITLSVKDRDIGGLGIHIVKNIMNEVSYTRKIDKNLITLVKIVI